MPKKKEAYQDTTVPVDRSRGAIEKILREWGIEGMQWEDDFQSGATVLRFRWKRRNAHGNSTPLVARLRLEIPRDLVTDKAVQQARRRAHRVAYWWLKAALDASKAGLFDAEDVILPWIEDAGGTTIAEALRPRLSDLSTRPLALRA